MTQISAGTTPRKNTGASCIREWRSLLPSGEDYADLRYTWRGDLAAGVTVGIVALPLALVFGGGIPVSAAPRRG